MKKFYQVMIALSVLEIVGGVWADGGIIEETVIDEKTGLEWRITPQGGEFSDKIAGTLASAAAYCDSLGDSWRLPNVAEFQSIIAFDSEETVPIKDGLYRDHELGTIKNWYFVTSTYYPGDSDFVNVMNLNMGTVSAFIDYIPGGWAIRCVNGG